MSGRLLLLDYANVAGTSGVASPPNFMTPFADDLVHVPHQLAATVANLDAAVRVLDAQPVGAGATDRPHDPTVAPVTDSENRWRKP